MLSDVSEICTRVVDRRPFIICILTRFRRFRGSVGVRNDDMPRDEHPDEKEIVSSHSI
jgi:hypothetical protein